MLLTQYERRMTSQRLCVSLLLGAALTPLAGYVGALAMPALMTLWFWSIVVSLWAMSLKLAAVLFLLPSLEGAKYAWPVTCILLPLTVGMQSRARWWTPLVCLLVGATGGLLVVYLQNRWNLAPAAGLAGAILGLTFGYVIWLADRHISIGGTIVKTSFPRSHWILGASLSVLFIFASAIYLVNSPQSQVAEVSVRDCGKLGGKLTPEKDSTSAPYYFKCVGELSK
jgi:hypothetical protein